MDRRAYKAMDKRIKREARIAKQRSFTQFVKDIDHMPAHRAVSRMSKMVKARRQRRLQQAPASDRIAPVEFTCFVATQHHRFQGERAMRCRRFSVGGSWRQDIEWSLKVAPRGKATGGDEVFVEALHACDEEVVLEWLVAIWTCSGQHGILPTAWRKSILCPILEKEPASLPQKWRAIALLSQARKVIEKVIDVRIRNCYKFHRSQCGFRQQRSVETAILRLMRAIDQGCNYVCVLDLKQAYASVPRGQLMERAYSVLPRDLAAMIETLLSNTLVSTVGDELQQWMEIRRGVPEGSPMSPALFNLFIDPLAVEVEDKALEWELALNLFADDIIIMAPSADKMQRLLHVCGGWATAHGLKWGIGKCHALAAPGVERPELILDGETLQYSDCADYLGVSVNAEGITAGATIERLRKAERRLRQLRAAGINRPRASVTRLRSIYAALVRPLWTYGIHLTPFTDEVKELAAALLDAATEWLFPRLQKHSKRRMRRLLGIEDVDITRRIQLHNMAQRLEHARSTALDSNDLGEVVYTTHDAQMARKLVEDEEEDDVPIMEQLARWEQVETGKARRRFVAVANELAPHPLWTLPSARHSVCAANWTLGRFPPDRAAARWYLGSGNYGRLDLQLRLIFNKPSWGTDDKRRAVRALEAMSEYWPSPLRWYRSGAA